MLEKDRIERMVGLVGPPACLLLLTVLLAPPLPPGAVPRRGRACAPWPCPCPCVWPCCCCMLRGGASMPLGERGPRPSATSDAFEGVRDSTTDMGLNSAAASFAPPARTDAPPLAAGPFPTAPARRTVARNTRPGRSRLDMASATDAPGPEADAGGVGRAVPWFREATVVAGPPSAIAQASSSSWRACSSVRSSTLRSTAALAVFCSAESSRRYEGSSDTDSVADPSAPSTAPSTPAPCSFPSPTTPSSSRSCCSSVPVSSRPGSAPSGEGSATRGNSSVGVPAGPTDAARGPSADADKLAAELLAACMGKLLVSAWSKLPKPPRSILRALAVWGLPDPTPVSTAKPDAWARGSASELPPMSNPNADMSSMPDARGLAADCQCGT